MLKNVAGQTIGCQMISATDGSEFTGAVTVYITGDGGTQAVGSVGSGACTHEGHGYHSYAPSQDETNFDHVAFTFVGTGAVSSTVQVAPGGSGNLTAQEVENAVWDANRSAHATTGTFGEVTTPADVATQVRTELTPELTRIDAAVSTRSAVSDIPTAGAVADQVWDEALSGHATAGSAGSALGTASSGGVDPAVLSDAIWDELLSGHATAGSAGKKLADLLNADLSGVATSAALAAIDALIDAIKAKTDNLPAQPAAVGSQMDLVNAPNATAVGALQSGLATAAAVTDLHGDVAVVAGYVDTEVAAIKAKTDNLPAAPAAVTDIPSAASIVSAIFARAFGAAYANLTFDQMVKLLAVVAAGKLSGAGTATETFRNLADTADAVVATVDASGNRTAITRTL